MVHIHAEFSMWVDVITTFEKKQPVSEDKWCIIKLSTTNVVNRIPFSKLKKSTINLKFMKWYWERTTMRLHSYTLHRFVLKFTNKEFSHGFDC